MNRIAAKEKIAERHPGGFEMKEVEGGGYEVCPAKPRRTGSSESLHVTKIELPDLGERASLDLLTLPDEIEISFSSEKPVRRWGTDEILSHDPEDANFERLAETGAILKNHNPSTIVGTPLAVWRDDDKHMGRARLQFGTTRIAQDAKREVLIDKSLRGVSVGYAVHKEVFLPDENSTYRGRISGNPDGGTWVATDWEAYEASLTPIPADPSVGVGREQETETENKEKRDMDKQKKKDDAVAGAGPSADDDQVTDNAAPETRELAADPVDVKKEVREAVAAEAMRSGKITELCQRHSIDQAAMLEMVRDTGLTVNAAGLKILDLVAARNSPVGQVEVIVDDRQKFGRAAVEYLQLRTNGIKPDKCEHGGEEMTHMSLIELAKASLQRAGIRVPSDPRAICEMAMRGPKIGCEEVKLWIRGADAITGTTSDFAYILASSAYKSIIDAYNTVPTTYERWCKIGSVRDFKSVNRIKLSEAGDLQQLLEAGKYESTAISESRNPIQVYTYALKWNISRQAIINDDLDAFSTIPAALARSGARLPNVLAVVHLLSNPTLTSDSLALFGTGHANLNAETDYALSSLSNGLAGIKNMIQGMQSQTAMMHALAADKSKSVYLAPDPVTLLTGQTGQFVARQVLGATSDPSQNNTGVPNPVQGLFTPVVEPLLENSGITGYSSTAYYGFADPNTYPVIEVAFLNGVREPYMEEADQTDADGRVWKIRHDVGVAAIDYIGAYKETGVDA